MDTYIVLDLEWNQSPDGKEGTIAGIPFEIIEIGAVKLDEEFNIIGEFHRMIRPTVYNKIHFKVYEVIHMEIEELRQQGEPFAQVIQEFWDWVYCSGERPHFCTWGSMDLTELQRNIEYYGVKNNFSSPLFYYDIQKLYTLLYHCDDKNKPPLDKAVEEMSLKEDRGFHHALDDAYYTSKIMQTMDFQRIREYVSLDYYHTPKTREEEIYLVFPDYAKYVSREFPSKEEAIADKTVADMLCYRCNRMLRKRIRWFSANQRNYYGLALCPEHGFVRGKIRMKSNGENFFVVKTMKIVGKEKAQELYEKREDTRKKRSERNRLKRLREKVKGKR